MLTRSGLAPALASYAARVGRPEALRIGPRVAEARFPERIETTAYFCCVEVLGLARGDAVLELDGAELVLLLREVSLDSLNHAAILDRVAACEGSIRDGEEVQVRLPSA